jgi:hypothetical protein
VLRSLENKRIMLDATQGPSVVEKILVSTFTDLKLSLGYSVDWILNLNSLKSWNKMNLNGTSVIVGPNIEFGQPHLEGKLQEIPDLKIIVPSDWVIPIIQERLTWFSGEFIVFRSVINLDFWKPKEKSKRDLILIYRKLDKSDSDFKLAVEACDSAGFKYKVITYGKYTRRSFRRTLRTCRAAIWLGTTESQGIALLECWAMNVPTLVRNENTYKDEITKKTFEASGAPYLVQECGELIPANLLTANLIVEFLNHSNEKNPRDYVVEVYSREKSIKNLISILRL